MFRGAATRIQPPRPVPARAPTRGLFLVPMRVSTRTRAFEIGTDGSSWLLRRIVRVAP